MTMTSRYVSDDDLSKMEARAQRVLYNNNASGSARALAADMIRLTTLLAAARRGRGRRRQIKALNDLFYGDQS